MYWFKDFRTAPGGPLAGRPGPKMCPQAWETSPPKIPDVFEIFQKNTFFFKKYLTFRGLNMYFVGDFRPAPGGPLAGRPGPENGPPSLGKLSPEDPGCF